MNEKKEKHRPQPWTGCPIEEEFFGQDRKLGKQMRKKAIAKDRSKYKKTDQNKKIEKPIEGRESLLLGKVISIVPQGIIVSYEGKEYCCSLRGVLKKEKSQAKNLITVGDNVLFELFGSEGLISFVEPRQTVLSRADNLSRRKEQLIASNVDQVLITVAVVNPELKSSLIDRYIIAAEKGNMVPVIVVNKVDLVSKEKQPFLVELKKAYEAIGIPFLLVSAEKNVGIDQLKAAMKDKTSVFAGQSGVGKSSLINLVAGLNLRVGDIVEKTQKGSHTTTTANLIPLPFGGWCVDTPGIKSFGVWELKKEDIAKHFKEIYEYGKQCKYPNCTHVQEEDCAVKLAVEDTLISPYRYNSYVSLLEELEESHKRR